MRNDEAGLVEAAGSDPDAGLERAIHSTARWCSFAFSGLLLPKPLCVWYGRKKNSGVPKGAPLFEQGLSVGLAVCQTQSLRPCGLGGSVFKARLCQSPTMPKPDYLVIKSA